MGASAAGGKAGVDMPPAPRPPARKPWPPRHRLPLLVAAVAVALAGSATIVVEASSGGSSAGPSSVPPSRLPGELVGPAPWGANVKLLRERLAALGLPALSVEGTTLHIHQHLDVFVKGKRVTVPAGIGIDELDGFISPLHTHDTSGVIHVESPAVRTFTLGQFFAVWGLRLTPRCLGGYCANGTRALRVFAGGRRVAGDPRRLPLAAHQEIVVTYGTPSQLPRKVPSNYHFPLGL